mmetsp:Transcript_7227/g.13704  ORF Transcript_7227/g.13704 Transcript_7227/m.13704 type:complete len:212 (+) Transcript_7227:33-668(+)
MSQRFENMFNGHCSGKNSPATPPVHPHTNLSQTQPLGHQVQWLHHHQHQHQQHHQHQPPQQPYQPEALTHQQQRPQPRIQSLLRFQQGSCKQQVCFPRQQPQTFLENPSLEQLALEFSMKSSLKDCNAGQLCHNPKTSCEPRAVQQPQHEPFSANIVKEADQTQLENEAEETCKINPDWEDYDSELSYALENSELSFNGGKNNGGWMPYIY